ncbi:pilus assembly protein PilM [Saccharibacillus sp. CPCC 101409]|uniref:pilus assembly protein PilM n=1 Tax=Saccharibacillus sp. CPCC 101409 TaxID=3058041 RepID=UPI002673805B|nr:pilus assembly protein PilM [Saccharibacillus sp. CPCC 101409]MDO3412043.1 pilus assembly protein PilM [Saccharibacillus sp. CPCC 101409]
MLGIGSKKAGLTIEQTGVRFVRLKNNKTWEIDKQSYLPLESGTIIENQISDEDGLRSQIRQWAEKEGLKGSRVALSVPPSQVIIRKMSIPAVQPKQVQQLVALEVETGLHLPFEEPVYDYIPIGRETQLQDDGREEEVTRVLVFAAPRPLIAQYVEILDEAGIKTDSVEVSATALARMAEIAQGQPFGDTMLVHLEHAQLDVYMFREGHPVFMRTLNLLDLQPEAPLFESESYLAQKSALGTDRLAPEQIVEITAEISRMLNFYQYSLHDGTARITELVVTGPAASREQLVNELRLALAEIDIHELKLEQPPGGREENAALNLYRVSVGAALRDEKNSLIDLLPREDRETKIFPYALGALLIIWVLALGGTVFYYLSVQKETEAQQTQIEQLNTESQVKQLKLQELNGSTASPETLIQEILKARTDAVAVLKGLNAAMPKGGIIRNIAYKQGTSIDLTVDFTQMDQAAAYLTRLKEADFTTDASISRLYQETDAGTGIATASRLYGAVYRIDMAASSEAALTGSAADALVPEAGSAADTRGLEVDTDDAANP